MRQEVQRLDSLIPSTKVSQIKVHMPQFILSLYLLRRQDYVGRLNHKNDIVVYLPETHSLIFKIKNIGVTNQTSQKLQSSFVLDIQMN